MTSMEIASMEIASTDFDSVSTVEASDYVFPLALVLCLVGLIAHDMLTMIAARRK